MKGYEKSLLNSIKGEYNPGNEEPLKNIKKGMGSLRHVVGNPMFKAEINLQITQNWGGALPANLQVPIPVNILGLTDFYSSYYRSNFIVPLNVWLKSSTAIPFFGIAGFNFNTALANAALGAIMQVRDGDFIACYQDAVPAANFRVIRIRCSNVSYGTFLNSFVSDLCVCNKIRYIVPAANINQLVNPIIFGYQSLFGKLFTDSIDPRMYQTPDEFQNQIADIPVKFPIDKNLMLNFYMDFNCLNINLIFFIEKVEPLTLRNKYI